MRTARRGARAGGLRPAIAAVALAALARTGGAASAPPGPAARLSELVRASRNAALPVVVRTLPTVEEQAAEDGDAAFATYVVRHHRVEVHVAKDAPASVDLVSPVLESAGFLCEHPDAQRTPVLLAAWGAWKAGRWWGRPVETWAAMLRAADVLPRVEDLCRAGGRADAPGMLEVGAAAAAIDAWARTEGARAVETALASGKVPVATVRQALASAARRPYALPARRPLPAGRLRGIAFAMENSVAGSYLSRRSAGTLGRLSSDGANAVSVIPYAFQRSARSPEIRFPGRNPRGETEEGVLRAIEDARRQGMAALVKPQIWLWRGFTGDIAMTTDADWAEWFRQYRAYLVRFAVVAEAARADLFDVGVELCASERREREWRETIAAVRAATGASLVYSCNWGKGVDAVPFWDALDAIGVDLYDPLSSRSDPTDAVLAAGARAAMRPLAAASARLGRPVYLTEVGFPSVAGAWLAPNDEDSPRPFSASDPARCARAVFAALDGETWWRGMFWWKAFSDGHGAGDGRKSFNIVGRPIETAIREGFARITQATGAAAPASR